MVTKKPKGLGRGLEPFVRGVVGREVKILIGSHDVSFPCCRTVGTAP